MGHGIEQAQIAALATTDAQGVSGPGSGGQSLVVDEDHGTATRFRPSGVLEMFEKTAFRGQVAL